MNPDTGEFHGVEKYKEEAQKRARKELADKMEKRGVVQDKLYKLQRVRNVAAGELDKELLQHHPKHVDLILSASRKPVPAHWPIFTIGEEIRIADYNFTLIEVLVKDLILQCEDYDFYLSKKFMIKGHVFRYRKIVRDRMTIRPEVGRPHNYLEKNK